MSFWGRRAEVVSVYDGDTLKVILDQGFGDTKALNLRLYGVHAPELHQVGGPETKAFVEQWLVLNALGVRWSIAVTTIRVRDDSHEIMTLSRYLGVVTNLDGSVSLNKAISAFVAAQDFSGGIGV